MVDILNNALKFVSKIENADWSFPSQMYPFEMEQPVGQQKTNRITPLASHKERKAAAASFSYNYQVF